MTYHYIVGSVRENDKEGKVFLNLNYESVSKNKDLIAISTETINQIDYPCVILNAPTISCYLPNNN